MTLDCVPYEPDTSCCADWSSYPSGVSEWAKAMAWSALRTLTAGRVGNCPVVMRPCLSAPCNECATDAWMHPHIRDGYWINSVCGSPRCSCARLCEIAFPGPVAEVLEVSWSGSTIPLSAFRIDNGNLLVRQDGECWPSCQRMDLPLGEPCTLGVTYVPGLVPGIAGLWAAGVLACEFAKACTGAKCRLPASVTSISRQGVSMDIDTGLWAGGLTGIREVDAYILSVNPNQLAIAPMVWSPDIDVMAHRYTLPVDAPTVRTSSQLVRFDWIEADQVSRFVLVRDGVAKGWLGSYKAELRTEPNSSAPLVATFTVQADPEGPDVRLMFGLDPAASASVPAGTYYWDAQQIGGPTRLQGTATVAAQVTLVP